jgi:hypothetical protein
MYLEIYPFLLDLPIIIVNFFKIFLNDPLDFSNISCNIPFFLSTFIDLGFLSLSFV